MKIRFLMGFLFCLLVLISASYAAQQESTSFDKPLDSQTSSAVKAEDLDKRADTLLKTQQNMQQDAFRMYRENADKSGSLMHKQQSLLDQSQKYLNERDELLAREQEDQKRFEKILDKWEAQQAQYQKYLDSLPTSQPKEAH